MNQRTAVWNWIASLGPHDQIHAKAGSFNDHQRTHVNLIPRSCASIQNPLVLLHRAKNGVETGSATKQGPVQSTQNQNQPVLLNQPVLNQSPILTKPVPQFCLPRTDSIDGRFRIQTPESIANKAKSRSKKTKSKSPEIKSSPIKTPTTSVETTSVQLPTQTSSTQRQASPPVPAKTKTRPALGPINTNIYYPNQPRKPRLVTCTLLGTPLSLPEKGYRVGKPRDKKLRRPPINLFHTLPLPNVSNLPVHKPQTNFEKLAPLILHTVGNKYKDKANPCKEDSQAPGTFKKDYMPVYMGKAKSIFPLDLQFVLN